MVRLSLGKKFIFLKKYNLKFKIASAMIVDEDFLKAVSKEKHTFISTGMSTKENIDNAVKIFREKIIVPLSLCIVSQHIR